MSSNDPDFQRPKAGFNVDILIQTVENATISAQAKLQEIKARRSAISIGDMFDMQMLMNNLSQMSEMTTAIVSSANNSITTMAKNIR